MSIKNFLKNKINSLFSINRILENQNELKKLLGQIELTNRSEKKFQEINDLELKIFSQFGEDGLINFLINNINIKNKKFIEFGVENYEEANTRFLLENNGWSGLIFDSSKDNVEYIKKQNYYWKNDLTVHCEFITKENINRLFSTNNYEGEIGLLSIDIDGNDYWIWKSIEVINPNIVIIEFNARLGVNKSITVPYKEKFNRTKEHYSNIYFGASLPALYKLAKTKGYELICTNKDCNNAFFIKKNILDNLQNKLIKEKIPKQCYFKPSFNESLDENGTLNKIDEENEKKILDSLEFIEV